MPQLTMLGKVIDFLQQGNVSKMVQPSRLPDRNPIKHIWDELGHAITSMENLPPNLGELRQVLLEKWAEISAECLQRLVASMSRHLAAIIPARGDNTQHWPDMHKTTPTGSKKHVCLARFTTITIQWHYRVPFNYAWVGVQWPNRITKSPFHLFVFGYMAVNPLYMVNTPVIQHSIDNVLVMH